LEHVKEIEDLAMLVKLMLPEEVVCLRFDKLKSNFFYKFFKIIFPSI
jgi:hypothetical protein